MDEVSSDLLPRAGLVGLVHHLQQRAKLLIVIFSFGFVAGYPFAGEMISWLLDANGFRPEGVQIVILQPMEVVLLQLRIATQIGFALMIIALVCDLAWNGKRIITKARRLAIDSSTPRLRPLLISIVFVILLATLGAVYARYILVPMLLDYLANDAVSSGFANTWQLQSWIGFIVGLFFGSIIGFQVPLLTTLLLRVDLIERNTISENRNLLWFAALFVGALLSPPDPLSLFLVGGPMLILLEISLLWDRITNR